MRYLPKSPADRSRDAASHWRAARSTIFSRPIPAEYRLERDLKMPRQMAESEIVDWFRERSRENGDGYATFLGAGAYSHYRPVIIDSLISRGEFLHGVHAVSGRKFRRARCNPSSNFRR